MGRHSGCGDSMVGIGPVIVAAIMCFPIWIGALFVPVNLISVFVMLILYVWNNEREFYLYYKNDMACKVLGSIDSWPAGYEDCYDFRPISYVKYVFAMLRYKHLYCDETHKLCYAQIDNRHKKMMRDLQFFKKTLIEDLSHYDKVNVNALGSLVFNVVVTNSNIDSVLSDIDGKQIKDIHEEHTYEYVPNQRSVIKYTVTVT